MEPSVTDRIPPPAWAGRPALLRVLGERCVAATTFCVVGLAAGAGAVVLAQDRLLPLIATWWGSAVRRGGRRRVRGVGPEKAVAEALGDDEGPSRSVDRSDNVMAPASWQRLAALEALLPLDHSVGAVNPIGRPVVVGAAGLLIGLGIGAWASAGWVRRWERREHTTLYQHEVRVDPTPQPAETGRTLTPEETARVQRRLMTGQGLDARGPRDPRPDRRPTGGREGRAAADATSRHGVVVPHPVVSVP